MELEIVERSSGYWIDVKLDSMFGEYRIKAWHEPFVHLSQAINQLNRMI